MKYQILLVILSLCISFSVANRNWGLVIDDFSTTNRDLLIALKNIDVFPYIAHTSIISDTILGTERDHILRALAGTNGYFHYNYYYCYYYYLIFCLLIKIMLIKR